MELLIAFGSIVATLLVVVIVRNLSTVEKQLEHKITPDFCVGDPAFERAMDGLLGSKLLGGNRITPLVNGCRLFPDMLEAIRGAKHSVTLETYIYWSGHIGRQVADALIERAQAGVHVHVLVDWAGSRKMENELLERLRAPESRIEFHRYRPPSWRNLGTMNNRTHRKILVVDGRIAYTGGACIADAWDGDAQDTDHWRDTLYRLEGPAAAQMQAAFMDNWVQVAEDVLLGDDYLPPLPRCGDVRAHVFRSGPFEGLQSARLMYLISIACARRHIRLGHSYFIPDRLCREALISARKRGVKVEVIIAGATDAPVTRHCTHWLLGDLLKAGIEVYEYQPAMYHCKLMIVDDLWVSVGSTNFDTRSFRLNDEVTLNAYDAEFARGEIEQFERDKLSSRRITLEEWNARPAKTRAIEFAASLLRTQL